ncbi:MAG: hypothetical protein KZQ96_22995 [Candidatus Thiodiazotropha sp. (ex Lucinoma borealis)]|nr:hypothetical protein [Candidatus Thiodiazotropha sp. (ex Lucinoma borealis)]
MKIDMDRDKAIELFGPEMEICEDNSLHNSTYYVSWNSDSHKITLDDKFTIEQLEALVWWIRTYKVMADM